ncbi:MAG: TatD family hydrolase [Methyloceanibacter sp.]|nr:MAG: TatD family hydrolase [Methyloceanibacter sp.]
MRYIDAHCHIDLYDDPADELARAASADVGIVAVTNAPFVYDACCKLGSGQPNVWPAVGLHPELATQYAHQVDDLIRCLETTRFVGEVGLDYRVTDPATHNTQRDVFGRVLQACDERGDALLTIHSRGAEADVVSMLGSGFRGTPILHWYSGAIKHLEAAQANGCYFSVNSSMLASKNGRKLVARMDRARVVTESDGPFAKVTGKRARPGDIPLAVQALAVLWGSDSEAVRSAILKNWESIFRSG